MSTNSNKLGGLDMVVSVTQDAINYQFSQLHKQKIIHPRLDIVMGDTGVELHADLASPFLVLGAMGNQATFVLRMPTGTLNYWEGFGQHAVAHSLDFKDWSYAFNVGLDMQALSAQALANHEAIPPAVKDHLGDFNSQMFTIRHLFMDFENADLVTFDPVRTQMALPDGTKVTPNQMTQFQESIRNYFSSLRGSRNPFILGYTVEPVPNSGVPSPFDPTGSTFSTFVNHKDQGTSTLNFLLMTAHRELPTAPTLPPYVDGRIPPQEYDGRFIIGRRAFFDEWFLPSVCSKLDEKPWNRTPGQEYPMVEVKNSLTATQTGWSIENLYAYKMLLPNGVECLTGPGDRYDTDDRSRTTSVAFKNSGASAFQVDLVGQCHDKFNAEIRCAFTEHVGVEVAIDWTANVAFTAGTDGQLALTTQMDPQEPKTDMWGAGTKQNRETLTEIQGRMTAILHKVLSEVRLGALSGRVVMPAGGVFFFKNPQLDTDGNLFLDVSLKS